MSGPETRPRMMASFAHLDSLLAAIEAVQAAGYDDLEVFSPTPRHEIDQALGPAKKSPVRYFTFLGALGGLVGGFGLTLLTARIWNLIVGGKAIDSLPPFLVVAFELTILGGGLATLLAVLFFARLPRRQDRAYHPRFSDDRFGLLVPLPDDKIDALRSLLEAQHAERCWLPDESGDKS